MVNVEFRTVGLHSSGIKTELPCVVSSTEPILVLALRPPYGSQSHLVELLSHNPWYLKVNLVPGSLGSLYSADLVREQVFAGIGPHSSLPSAIEGN